MASAALAFKIFATDNASATFRAVANASDRLHGSLSAVGRIGAAIGHTVKVGAVAAGAGLAAAGAVGLRTASQMEQAQIAFTTMLGSAQRAQKFLGQLQRFAAATPFEFPELVTASQRLLAMGFAAKDVVPTLTAIGDAVAGLGGGAEQIDQVTTAIGQMMAKGKIQSDELLQLTEAGIPALKILADQYHVSAGKMQEMVTQGKVLSADALPKLIQGLEKGTKSTQGFGGMMQKQSQSLSGLFSTLKDNATMTLSNLVTPAIPAIKQGISLANTEIGKFAPKVQSALESAIQAAKTNAPKIGAAISDALHSDTAKKLTDTVSSIASTVGDAVSGMATDIYNRALAVGTGLFGGISDGVKNGDWSKLGQTIGEAIANSLHRIASIAEQITIGIGQAIEKVKWFDLADKLGKQVPTFLVGLAVGILNFDLPGLLRGLADHWFEVILGILTLAVAPARLVGKVGELLAKIPLVGKLLQWILEGLSGASKKVVGAVGDFLGFIGKEFLAGFRKVFPEVGNAFAHWLSLLPTRIGVFGIEAAQKAKAMVIGIGNAIKSGVGWVASKIGELVGTILRPFANAAGWLISKGMAIVRGLLSGMARAFGPVIEWARQIGRRILGAIGDFGHLLFDAGRAVIDGLVKGIESAMHKVTDIMGTVGGKVKGAFNKVLHIFSPSRVMAESGRYVMLGLVEGIESQRDAVLGAVAGVGVDIARAPFGATAGMSGAASSTVQARASSDAQTIAEAVYSAICRALSDARVQVDPAGVARLVQTGALRVAPRR